MLFGGIVPVLLSTIVALITALVGVWLTGLQSRTRRMVPFSAGLLLGVALFGLFPEALAAAGALGSFALFGLGYLFLMLVDQYVYPVCPTCSHDHDHKACSTALHGFAVPLVSATMLHSFLDGWSIATSGFVPAAGVRFALPLAILVHKIPEGLALGSILRASLKSRGMALVWCFVVEGTTLMGGWVGLAMAPSLGTVWITYPLAVAGGCFFYLAAHAVHEEWKRTGPGPAFVTALTGAAGAAALQQGIRAFFR